ncbi:MAG: DUF1553 domain-containing protein [Planctomycetaceae bacterium]
MNHLLSHRLWLTATLTCVAFLAWTPVTAVAQQAATDADRLRFFETHVRPVLHSKCVKCHGENQQKGGLRLDSLEAVLQGGESGPAAIAGKPHESLLLEAVRYESFEMPPDQPLADSQIAALEKWLTDGAAWPMTDGKSVRLDGAAFSNEELNFWSLQPIARPDIPKTTGEWGYNALDQFVAAKLEAANISAAPGADDSVLVRRLYFDVLGVPPSPADIADFERSAATNVEGVAGDRSAQWAGLVEQLLADPRYGEHWGRYWLDIVRYAESDGFRADFYRPDAWRYRDYVVDAFNTDKPYDQFVREQLAGDEIAPDNPDALIATGYLRTYLYEYNQRDARTQWQDILNQVTDVTGEAFLGMGVGCARCHDHKFDPILQEDYFRLQACFGTMVPRDDIPAADPAERERYSKAYEAWLAKGAELRGELQAIREPYLKRAAKGAIERFPEDIQEIMAKPQEQWTALDGQLGDLVNRQILFDQERMKIKDEDQKRIQELEKQIATLAGNEPPKLPTASTVADFSSVPQPIHLAANPARKTVVAGGFTIIAADAFQPQATDTSTGQRTALANWIASPDNPLTARVIVNRIWQRHFGMGLVETASDFGSLGGRPSHPELLDWLATEFMAHNWSIKWLHRQILNSATWQMSSFHPQAARAEQVDPDNRLRWRFPVRRLNAEQIRDAMLVASGELLSEQGGPSVDHKSLRRSLYLKALRNTPEPLMRSLDGVDGLNSISKRSTTTTPTQALNLMNGDWVRQRATAMASRVLDVSEGNDPATLADVAFRTALGRGIQPDEVSRAVTLIRSASPGDNAGNTPDWFGSLTEDAGNAVKIGNHALPPLATQHSEPAMVAPFTFVGMFKLNSLYGDATVRTLISQWNSSNESRGWALGVTSEKSAYQPRNLILQVVSDMGYEVVPSNLRPELDVIYMAAVTVQQTEEGAGRATFYLQPLDGKHGSLQTAEVTFKTATGISGRFPVMLGGRAQQKRHIWDGQMDQVALFSRAWTSEAIGSLFEQRLRSSAIMLHGPAAFWNFDDTNRPLTDASTAERHLQPTEDKSLKPETPLQNAVAELCHVLLNSNEFVYID